MRKQYAARNGLTWVPCKKDALEGADALVILTEWQDYKVPDLQRLSEKRRDRVVFDGRNLLAPTQLREAGLTCSGIGLGLGQAPQP